VLAGHGVVSRFGVDFLVDRGSRGGRVGGERPRDQPADGGTTHPYLALQFLTGGPSTRHGPLPLPERHAEVLQGDRQPPRTQYRGLLPEDLVDILTVNKLHYSHGTESGVLFHLIGALSSSGSSGSPRSATARKQVDDLYAHTLEVLDRETTYGR
jgi:hypothetical protein